MKKNQNLLYQLLDKTTCLDTCVLAKSTCLKKYLKVSRRFAELRFREARGHSILEEIQQKRLERVRTLLRETSLPIAEVGERCGYQTETYLKTLFKKRFGMTMRDYRKNY